MRITADFQLALLLLPHLTNLHAVQMSIGIWIAWEVERKALSCKSAEMYIFLLCPTLGMKKFEPPPILYINASILTIQ